jgi:hypothetical protein
MSQKARRLTQQELEKEHADQVNAQIEAINAAAQRVQDAAATTADYELLRHYGKITAPRQPGIIELIRAATNPDVIRVNVLRACSELNVPERVKKRWRATAEARIKELEGKTRQSMLLVPAHRRVA